MFLAPTTPVLRDAATTGQRSTRLSTISRAMLRGAGITTKLCHPATYSASRTAAPSVTAGARRSATGAGSAEKTQDGGFSAGGQKPGLVFEMRSCRSRCWTRCEPHRKAGTHSHS